MHRRGPKPPRIIEGSLRTVKPHPVRTALRRRQFTAATSVHCQCSRIDGDGHMRAIEVAPACAATVRARRRESLYVRATCSVLASASVAASRGRGGSGPSDHAGTFRRAEPRGPNAVLGALMAGDRSRRPTAPAVFLGAGEPAQGDPGVAVCGLPRGPGPEIAGLGPASLPGCEPAAGAARWAIPPRISTGGGDVAIVLAARCGEHGAGRRRENRDRSHGVCDTIRLHDLR